jgi:hypothetical protein
MTTAPNAGRQEVVARRHHGREFGDRWLPNCENLEAERSDYRFFTSRLGSRSNLRAAAVEAMTTHDSPEQPTEALEPVTTELTTPIATATDRCPNCDTRMAPDQRYCINCGERRAGGGLRDALPKTTVAAAATPPRRRGFTASSSTNLIAGVATLLIALGVGVLIGRTDHSAAKSAAPQVVTVQSSGGTAATSGAATTAATTAGTAAAAKHAAKKHAAKKVATHQTAVQKTAAQNGVKLPPPVVKVGQKCAQGAKGCQGGKFTGNFFGGG